MAKPCGQRNYIDKAMRHVEEFRLRRSKDDESGEHPLAHAICDLLFVLELEEGGVEVGARGSDQAQA